MLYSLQFIKTDIRVEYSYKMEPEEAELFEEAFRNKEP